MGSEFGRGSKKGKEIINGLGHSEHRPRDRESNQSFRKMRVAVKQTATAGQKSPRLSLAGRGEEKGEQKNTEKGEKEKFGEKKGEQGTRNWRLELLLFSWVG